MLLTDATITELIHIWGVWVGETYTCYIYCVKLGKKESVFKPENSETQKNSCNGIINQKKNRPMD